MGDFPDGSGVRAWDLASGKQRLRIEHSLPEGAGARMTFSADGADGGFVAVASGDEVLLWRTADPEVPVFRHSLSSTGSYDLGGTSALRLDLDRRRIRYLEVRGWERNTAVASLALDEALDSAYPLGPVRAATYSPDGRTLAAVRRLDGATRFQLLDAATAEVLADLPHPQMFCLPDPTCENHTVFSADGRYLAVGGRGGVTIWDGSGRRRLANLPATPGGSALPEDSGGALDDHQFVTTVAFSPDARYLAVGTAAGTLQIWQTEAPHLQPTVFPGLGGRVQSVAFGPDGGTLYAASTHRRSRSYALDLEHVAATVCERTGGGLSRADWKSYLPDVPYRDVCRPRSVEAHPPARASPEQVG